ncbi:hypothetical protein ABGB12_26080 [Actinocorallia sp. B10E7]|uniref:hypothetical protein n=1 Tax=Actinocorallia sp. B10E7 TaxID=3153558 RepID=UPI00325D4B44
MAGVLLAASLVAGCSSESQVPSDPTSGPDDVQEKPDGVNEPISLPDACALVEDPEPGLLGNGTLVVADQSKTDYSVSCEKRTELGGSGISSLTVRVSAIPSMGTGETVHTDILEQVKSGECDRIPDVQEIACLKAGKFSNLLRVGRGAYQADIIFHFTGAGEEKSRRFAERTATQVAQKLA